MAETLFHHHSGKLVIGLDAQNSIEYAESMGEIDFEHPPDGSQPSAEPLGRLLADDDFPYQNGEYPALPRQRYTRSELAEFGSWIVSMLKHVPERPFLKHVHWERAHILRLVPSRAAYQHHFRSIDKLRESIGEPIGRERGKYDHWSAQQFSGYAARLSSQLDNRRPLRTDYAAAAVQGHGPSPDIISRQIGSINELNDRIGFPNIYSWEIEDYTHWAVQVMQANGSTHLSTNLLRILSSRDRGPSERSVTTRFDSIKQLRSEAIAELVRVQSQDAKTRIMLADNYARLERAGSALALEETAEPTPQTLAYTAKFLVVELCVPHLTIQEAAILAARPHHELTRMMLAKNERLTAGLIDSTIARLGVQEMIQPSSDSPYLCVTDEELGLEPGYRRRFPLPYVKVKLPMDVDG